MSDLLYGDEADELAISRGVVEREEPDMSVSERLRHEYAPKMLRSKDAEEMGNIIRDLCDAIEAEARAAVLREVRAEIAALDLSRVKGREPFVVSRTDALALIDRRLEADDA